MSFPVPVAYDLNAQKDTTIIKYNNGDQWEGLPVIGEGDSQIKSLKFTTVEDHTTENPLVFNLDPSDRCEILYYIEGEYTPHPNEIIVGALGVYRGGADPAKAGHMIRTNQYGAYSGVSTSNAGTFTPETGECVIPNVAGYKIPKGYTFRLMQIKTGAPL